MTTEVKRTSSGLLVPKDIERLMQSRPTRSQRPPPDYGEWTTGLPTAPGESRPRIVVWWCFKNPKCASLSEHERSRCSGYPSANDGGTQS